MFPTNTDTALHGHRFLVRAGLGIANVFAWIFIFEYLYILSGSVERSLAGMFLIYILCQFMTVVLTPLAAAHLRRGTRRVMIWSLVFAGGALVMLGATLAGSFDTHPTAWGLAAFAVLFGAYRAFYFIPYQLNRTSTENMHPRDAIFYEFLLAFIPAFAGAAVLTGAVAPLKLLFGAAALLGLAGVLVFLLPNMYERFAFSYEETFKQLFLPRNQRVVWLSFLEGVQGTALFLIWPITVFLLFGWSYATLGLLFSVTLFVVILARLLFRKLFAIPVMERSIPVHVTLVVSGWVLRIVAGTPLGVVIADSYAHTTHPLRGTMTDPFSFEQAADSNTYIDEYTAIKEVAIGVGRIVFVAVLYEVILITSVSTALISALIAAGIAAGLSVVIARYRKTSLI